MAVASEAVVPMVVHWAVARPDSPGGVALPLALRVVQVGPKPGWPRMGDWFTFACGRSWIAVPAYFIGTRLVDHEGGGDWPYAWCPQCEMGLPVGMPRLEKDWTPRPTA